MPTSIRELKAHLSEHLRRVQAGESLEGTSHGDVVAHLLPPTNTLEPLIEILQRLPWLRIGKPGIPIGLEQPVSFKTEGPTLTVLLLEDRD